MPLQFGRQATVILEGTPVAKVQRANPTARAYQGLRIAFKITKGTSPTQSSTPAAPTFSTITIYNLNPESRAKVAVKDASVVLAAGYDGNAPIIFAGQVVRAMNEREGPDWKTTMTVGDGIKQIRDARASLTFGRGARAADVIRALALAMGLPLSTFSRLPTRTLPRGWRFSGRPSDGLNEILRGAGGTWMVQNGQIVVYDDDGSDGGEVVQLDAAHGLIGSPQIGDKGVAKIKALIQPNLDPHRLVSVKSAGGSAQSGVFQIAKVDLDGDTHAQPWYADMEATKKS